MTIDFSGATPAPAEPTTTPSPAVPAEPATPVTPEPQDNETFLEIGGRKFTKEDVVKKITNADSFIETLKAERAEDRALLAEVQEALKKQVNIQEVLKQMQPTQPVEQTAAPAVDPNAIASQVLATLQQQQQAQKLEQNWTEVTSKLSATYGDKVNEKVAAVAQENGLTLQEAAELGRSKPALFLKLFPEVSTKPQPTKPAFHSGSAPAAPPAPASSGFGTARTTRESVSIYLNRLKQLAGE